MSHTATESGFIDVLLRNALRIFVTNLMKLFTGWFHVYKKLEHLV